MTAISNVPSNPLMVVRTSDGCWRENLSVPIPTWSATRRTIRELIRMGYKFEDMAVIDTVTKRFLSFSMKG
jgi:hypothetical protein